MWQQLLEGCIEMIRDECAAADAHLARALALRSSAQYFKKCIERGDPWPLDRPAVEEMNEADKAPS